MGSATPYDETLHYEVQMVVRVDTVAGYSACGEVGHLEGIITDIVGKMSLVGGVTDSVYNFSNVGYLFYTDFIGIVIVDFYFHFILAVQTVGRDRIGLGNHVVSIFDVLDKCLYVETPETPLSSKERSMY